MKIILITSVRTNDDDVGFQIEKIYKAYLDFVKRNYMYQHGDIIKIPLFDEAVGEILFAKNTASDWFPFIYRQIWKPSACKDI